MKTDIEITQNLGGKGFFSGCLTCEQIEKIFNLPEINCQKKTRQQCKRSSCCNRDRLAIAIRPSKGRQTHETHRPTNTKQPTIQRTKPSLHQLTDPPTNTVISWLQGWAPNSESTGGSRLCAIAPKNKQKQEPNLTVFTVAVDVAISFLLCVSGTFTQIWFDNQSRNSTFNENIVILET